MSDCVEHLLEGRNAWELGILGYFVRARGIITTLLITFITMGVPFWWPDKFPNSININLKIGFLLFIIFFGIICSLGFYYLRDRSRRSLDIKAMLHDFAHFYRDQQTKLYNCNLVNVNPDHEDDKFQIYIEQICEKTKNYFSRITGKHSIEVAIRIAVDKSIINGKHEIFYKTIGRSSGLSKKRQDTTTDIAANEGIPRFFADKKSCGVLIYNNLEKASDINAYKFTNNDRIFKDEIKTMMVAPLNAWDGKKQSMIGILYITSRDSDIFSAKHIDTMRFITDTIANAIGFYVLKLKESGCLNKISMRKP
jgi:hypothetical protein